MQLLLTSVSIFRKLPLDGAIFALCVYTHIVYTYPATLPIALIRAVDKELHAVIIPVIILQGLMVEMLMCRCLQVTSV